MKAWKAWKKFVRWTKRRFFKKDVSVEPKMTDLKSAQMGQVEVFGEQLGTLEAVMETFLERDPGHRKEVEEMFMASNNNLEMAIRDTTQNSLAWREELRQIAIQEAENEVKERLREEQDLEQLRFEELEAQLNVEIHNREEAERCFCNVRETGTQMEMETQLHTQLGSMQALYEETLQNEKKEQETLRSQMTDEQSRREKAEKELEAKRESRKEAERLLLETETKFRHQLESKDSLHEETLQQMKKELEMMTAERDHEHRAREELEKVLLEETSTRNELEKRFQDLNNTSKRQEIEETLKVLLRREKELCGQLEQTADMRAALEHLREASQGDVEKRKQYKNQAVQVDLGGW